MPELEAAAPAEERPRRPALFDGDWHDTAVLGRGQADVAGPAIFELPGSTLVVPPGWRARSDAGGVVMER
jgi:N-methylhydantoinase A/oxoprolinase/acetone carboxylase beta subunit